MTQTAPPVAEYRPWLHRYAALVVLATLVLIAIGGTVTSKGAGMAVPDWPTTFGYNMFLAPLHVWWEQSDVFWEHFHRLMASLVGLLTIGITVWLWVTQKARPWLRWVGVALLALVIGQGIMGGLRVTEISLILAMVHGITGQIFLGLTVLIAAATSKLWLKQAPDTLSQSKAPKGLRTLALVLLAVLVVQLSLGAWVRHMGASLAIPDFPMSYGTLLPPMSQARIDAAIAEFEQTRAMRPYTVSQVAMQFTHRAWAIVVVAVSLALVLWLNIRYPGRRETAWPARWLLGLLTLQILLGASVVWSGRYPEIATAHQAVGASILAIATWLAIRVYLLGEPASREKAAEADSPAPANSSIEGQTA